MGSTDLLDFPVLIDITNVALRNTANGGNMQNANGYDIMFTGECDEVLHHDIEYYTEASGRLVAWVRIPVLSTSQPTEIKLNYGNASVSENSSSSATWSSSYEGVYHLHDDFEDETHGNNDATNNGSSDVAAQFGDGQDFDGTNDYVQSTSDLSTANDFSLSVWFKADATNYSRHLLWQGDNTGNGWGNPHEEMHLSVGVYQNSAQNDTLAFFLGDIHNGVDQGVLTVVTPFTDVTSWHHAYVNVKNMGVTPVAELYLDGILQHRDTGTVARTARTNWNSDMIFGKPGTNSRFYDGGLDEVRSTTVSRSPDWILTEYNNQNSPSTFYTVTAETPVSNADYISGNLFEDEDADGVKDVGEVGHTGATIQFLDDVNKNGVVDLGDTILNTDITDASGNFSFDVPIHFYNQQVKDGNNDSEENLNNGDTQVNGLDLDLGYESGTEPRLVGIRFQDLKIPQGATIVKAYVKFVSTTTLATSVELTIAAEDVNNSAVFVAGSATFDLSSRAKTAERTNWTPPSFTADQTYYTPDISNVIQEVTDRGGWAAGNSLSVLIEGGLDKRQVYTYNNDPNKAPSLYVEYYEAPMSEFYLLDIDESTLPATYAYTTPSEIAINFTSCAGDTSTNNFFGIQLTDVCGNALDDDGDLLIDCADSDCQIAAPGTITASNDTICSSSIGETYSIAAVSGATSYDWTVPVGAAITAGQGTTSITVDWGSTQGSVCVRSYNGFCYSSFTCKPILMIFPPATPALINH
ncbi:MAG: DUF2341 domain-containing protein [Chitinophagales bacterium]|nr:DUF2341 domain-containing protein [Chitinophagales bacterium]